MRAASSLVSSCECSSSGSNVSAAPRSHRLSKAAARPATWPRLQAAVGGTRVTRARAGGDDTATPPAIDFDALDLDDLELPDIDGDLRSIQERAGALFLDGEVATSFGNDEAAEDALLVGCVVVDRSHWARLRVAGEDRLSFLHKLTTNDVMSLQPGSGCETMLVNAQARCMELANLYAQPSSVMLTVPGESRDAVMAHLSKHVLYGDRVELTDVSARCHMLTVMGADAGSVMTQLGAEQLVGGLDGSPPPHSHLLLNFKGSPVVAAVGSGLTTPGFTLIADEASAADLWLALVARGAVPMGEAGWQRQRVLQGRPAAGSELHEGTNPLEVGLYHAVSLGKGCYMGQETLAKVSNLGATKQQLVGLALESPVSPGDEVLAATSPPSSASSPSPPSLSAAAAGQPGAKAEEEEGGGAAAVSPSFVRLGAVTSATDPAEDGSGGWALAVLRTRAKGAGGEVLQLEGLPVVVGDARVAGRVVVQGLRYPTRGFVEGGGKEDGGGEAAAAAVAAVAVEEEEAKARAERLAAMQARLVAWQAQQGQQQ